MTQGIESSSITETQEIPSGGKAGMAEPTRVIRELELPNIVETRKHS